MSVFAGHTLPPKPRPAVILVLAAVFIAAGAVILGSIGSGSRTASQLDALDTPAGQPEATTFPEPIPVAWEGRIIRRLASGQGADVESIDAPGGYFFAYFDVGFTASASETPVRIQGQWLGISCEYGRCAPEVQVESWQSVPIELE